MPTTKLRPRTVKTASFGTETLFGVTTQSQDIFVYDIPNSRIGTYNNGWKQAVKLHNSATTPMTADRVEYQRNPVKCQVLWDQRTIVGGKDWWLPCQKTFTGFPSRFSFYPVPSGMSTDVAQREAVKKFFRKVKNLEHQFSGGVFIGELRETLHMLRHPAESLFRSAKTDYLGALKKLRRKDPRNWARGLSGAWLEWSFGVKPLVSDIEDGVDAISRLLDKEYVKSNLITTVGRDEKESRPPSELAFTRAGMYFTGVDVRWEKAKVKYRGLYRAERTAPTAWDPLVRAQKMFGLTLNDFVPTIWELMPWSFLVDYFSNVGDVLEQSFTSLQGLRWCNHTVLRDAYVEQTTHLDTKKYMGIMPYPEYKNLRFVTGADSKLLIRRRTVSRDDIGPTVTPLYFELPGSPQKWLNIAALGVQANSIHPQDFKRWGRR